MSEAIPEKSAPGQEFRSINDEILGRLRDPVEVASRLGLTPRQGSVGVCPRCYDHDEEATCAFPDADLGGEATCYNCSWKGDVFDFIACHLRLSCKDFAEVLRARLTLKDAKVLAESLDTTTLYKVAFVKCPRRCGRDAFMLTKWRILEVHCYSCRLHGDVFDLVAAVRHLDPVKDHAQVQRAVATLAGLRRRREL